MSAAIGGAAGVGSTGLSSGAFGDVSSEDFIKVMMQELTNQDPFKPQDSSALLEQLSSLRSIESQLSLQQQLESLVMQNQFAAAGGLIGKMVEGLDDSNTRVSGVVQSVRVADGKSFLELDTGRRVSMDRLTTIAPSVPASATASAS